MPYATRLLCSVSCDTLHCARQALLFGHVTGAENEVREQLTQGQGHEDLRDLIPQPTFLPPCHVDPLSLYLFLPKEVHPAVNSVAYYFNSFLVYLCL